MPSQKGLLEVIFIAEFNSAVHLAGKPRHHLVLQEELLKMSKKSAFQGLDGLEHSMWYTFLSKGEK